MIGALAGILAVLLLAPPCAGQSVTALQLAAPPAQLHLRLTPEAEDVADRLSLAQMARPASAEREAADFLSNWGLTVPLATTAALLTDRDEGRRHSGELAAWSMLYTAAATRLLKAAVNSPRPARPTEHDGFPSGHASISFAFARSIAEDSDEWGAVAYAWAAAVAWSRVRRGDHDVPQVLAGAALGWWVADQVARDRRPRRAHQ